MTRSEGILFDVRIKKDAKVPNSQGIEVQAKNLFRFLKPGEKLTLPEARGMTGLKVYLSGLRLQDGELLIVATNWPGDNAIEVYKERWQIETLFSCLKGRGFYTRIFGCQP